ncbi:DUF1302 domain-containing protein [Frateuria defendens]|uniref:DUF1302 domain-containing protein n=1 Tax=Frateuria defendens TaxID=2219559 RepID=UPI00137930B1|nr:DUF1302 domain-containing protein [Frateuria defendens]
MYGAVLLAFALPSHAVDFKLADGEITGKWTTRVVAGAAMRTSSPSKHLVGKGYRSDGRPKGGDGADTADDGNVNYGKGDVYSNLYKVVSGVDLKYKNFGINASARAWYDAALDNRDVPQGSAANGFGANRPLSDRGLNHANRFSGFMWLNAYAYGHFALSDDVGLDLRAGKQTVKWGEDLFAQNLNLVNPIDYTTLHRPGTDPATEAQLPVELLWGKLGLGKEVSLEGFYQWKWRANEYDPCGTFFSSTDLGFDRSCSSIQSNAYYPINAYSANAGKWLSDSFMYQQGAILPGGPAVYGRDHGQWGVSLHYAPAALGTDFGAYYMVINSRSPYLNATTINPATQNNALVPALTAAGVPLAYANLSARLSSITEYWVFPNAIRVAGLSASTRVAGWKLAGEVSYTKDLPVQINTADMFAALTRNGGPIGDRMAGIAPGGVLAGYDRFDKTQAQVNAVRVFKDVWGADSALLAGEAVWSHANLPALADTRYGRGFAWGFSPQWSDGACSAVQNPQGCLSRGFYTRQAWGYRLKGQLNYALAGGWTLSPALGWAQDVHGFSVDNQLVDGRKQYTASLTAQYRKHYFATLSYTNWVDNAPYDVLKDHDFLSFAVGATF